MMTELNTIARIVNWGLNRFLQYNIINLTLWFTNYIALQTFVWKEASATSSEVIVKANCMFVCVNTQVTPWACINISLSSKCSYPEVTGNLSIISGGIFKHLEELYLKVLDIVGLCYILKSRMMLLINAKYTSSIPLNFLKYHLLNKLFSFLQ